MLATKTVRFAPENCAVVMVKAEYRIERAGVSLVEAKFLKLGVQWSAPGPHPCHKIDPGQPERPRVEKLMRLTEKRHKQVFSNLRS